MFTMMNTARLGVGLQGIGLSERAYQNALAYARDRLQTRSLSGAKFRDKPADPIIVHPDVRRMLLSIKSLTEGARLLALHAGTLVDIAHHAPDQAERAQADTLVSFLTPISKACQTEWSIENTYNALQCFGGHGYIHEHGMEQLARDARITTLYEGTTGIQSLDLIGRKTAASGAAGLKLFLGLIEQFASAYEGRGGRVHRPAARQGRRMGRAHPGRAAARGQQSGRTRRGQHRLPVLFRLRGPGLLVGAQRGRRAGFQAGRRVQAGQAGNGAFLLRPHPAAHPGPRRGHPLRRRIADGDGRRPLRRLKPVTVRRAHARAGLGKDGPMPGDRAGID
jgi:hypothetical protein